MYDLHHAGNLFTLRLLKEMSQQESDLFEPYKNSVHTQTHIECLHMFVIPHSIAASSEIFVDILNKRLYVQLCD